MMALHYAWGLRRCAGGEAREGNLTDATGAEAPEPNAAGAKHATTRWWIVARDVLICGAVVILFDRLVRLYMPFATAQEALSPLWFFATAPPVVLLRALFSGAMGLRLERYLSTGRKPRSPGQIVNWLVNTAVFEIPIGGFLLFGLVLHEVPLVEWPAPLPSSWLRALVGQWFIAFLLLNPVVVVLVKMIVDGLDFQAALANAGKNLFFINMSAGLFWTLPHLWSLSKQTTIETFGVLNVLSLGWGAILFVVTAEENRFKTWLRRQLDKLTVVFPFNWIQRFYQDPVALGAFVLAVLYALYAVLLATVAGLAFPAVGTHLALIVVALAAVLAPVLVPKLPRLIERTHAALTKAVEASNAP